MYQHPDYDRLFIVDHPLIQHKLTRMRMKECMQRDFSAALREIAMLMGYEITRDLALTTAEIDTPLQVMQAPVLDGHRPAIVPILRAGLGMSEGLQELMPSAPIGHIGLYRDAETHRPVEYLVKLPSAEDRPFILVDPMLATGHSAAYAAHLLIQHGVAPQHIRFMALVAAPEGVTEFQSQHPDITIYLAALDEKLNDKAYILPGLGDAGDRLFSTL